MYRNDDSFSTLADQVLHGDQVARSRLQDQLEHQMVYIVRRTLREHDDRTTLGRRILTVAQRMGLEFLKDAQQDSEKNIHRIAHELCERIIARLQPAPRDDFRERDTYCVTTRPVTVLS